MISILTLFTISLWSQRLDLWIKILIQLGAVIRAKPWTDRGAGRSYWWLQFRPVSTIFYGAPSLAQSYVRISISFVRNINSFVRISISFVRNINFFLNVPYGPPYTIIHMNTGTISGPRAAGTEKSYLTLPILNALTNPLTQAKTV